MAHDDRLPARVARLGNMDTFVAPVAVVSGTAAFVAAAAEAKEMDSILPVVGVVRGTAAFVGVAPG